MVKDVYMRRSEIAKLSDLHVNQIINNSKKYSPQARANALYIKEMRSKSQNNAKNI